MKNDTIDDLERDNFIVNNFDLSKGQDFLFIKTLKTKFLSYLWVVLACVFGVFFLFITIRYFITEGASFFLLLPFSLGLFCIIPSVLVLYFQITHKERWFFTQNELVYTSKYGRNLIIPQKNVSSIFIQEKRGITYGHYYSHISIHLKYKDNKTWEIITLEDKENNSSDALMLSRIISNYWDVPFLKIERK